MGEKQIIQAAIGNFNQQTGMAMRQVVNPEKSFPKDQQPDTFVEIKDRSSKFQFWVEIKNELREAHLGQIIEQMAKDSQYWLLICQYISKANRATLREKGINYLDASGNCNIRQGSLLLYINDQKVAPQREANSSKLWTPTGVRLVFSLLNNPDLINKSYRAIAVESLLGLGTIGKLITELVKEGYFSNYNNSYQLKNREDLLVQWVVTYSAILRPKLTKGRYRFISEKDRHNWQQLSLKKVYWGGEPAGALLTKHLHPEKFTIYSEAPRVEVMKLLRIVPDNHGEIELLNTFWNTESIKSPVANTVPPILAFAELNTSMDSRSREIAQRIKKQYNV